MSRNSFGLQHDPILLIDASFDIILKVGMLTREDKVPLLLLVLVRCCSVTLTAPTAPTTPSPLFSSDRYSVLGLSEAASCDAM